MIKAYALNKNGKIELTLEELQKLIDEAVEEGKRLVGQPSIVYRQFPIKTTPVVKRTEIGDPIDDFLPWWRRQGTCQCQTEAETPQDRTKETARERFNREFNEGVMRGTLLYLEAKRG